MWSSRVDPVVGSLATKSNGFAIRELMLVLGLIGAIVAGLILADPERNAARDSATRREVMADFELPLGDEFVCLVGLDQLGPPDSVSRPSFFSRVRLAIRQPEPAKPFLLEIVTGEHRSWQLASCRVWTLMPSDDVEAFLREHHQRATADPDLTSEERWLAEENYQQPAVEMACELEEPFARSVPDELRKNTKLVVTGKYGLHNLCEHSGFPLVRLAAAIRTAAERDQWTEVSTSALLAQEPIERPLNADEQRAVAQSLVRRLVEFLPAEVLLENNGI